MPRLREHHCGCGTAHSAQSLLSPLRRARGGEEGGAEGQTGSKRGRRPHIGSVRALQWARTHSFIHCGAATSRRQYLVDRSDGLSGGASRVRAAQCAHQELETRTSSRTPFVSYSYDMAAAGASVSGCGRDEGRDSAGAARRAYPVLPRCTGHTKLPYNTPRVRQKAASDECRSDGHSHRARSPLATRLDFGYCYIARTSIMPLRPRRAAPLPSAPRPAARRARAQTARGTLRRR